MPETDGQDSFAALRGLRVLVVDDDEDTRDLISITLRSVGASVFAADSVRAALEVLGQVEIELLISDIAMPFEDGYDLIRRLRHENASPAARTIPALAATAFTSPADRAKALSAGFQEHLPKPFQFRTLLNIAARLVGARSQPPASPPS